jgi:N-acetylglucosamine-6-sulfatase
MADTEENYRGKPEWVRRQRQSWHGVDGLYHNTTTMEEFTRDYASTLMAVDEGVGRIMDALREMDLLESTLIIFTSDNGFLFGEHGLIDKRCMYEPSIRVPLIVHCPELFEADRRNDKMILNVDFAPTILEAAGLEIPATMQGRSFYGLLTGAQSEWRDAFLYEYFWERSFPQTPTVIGVRTDSHKLMRFHGIWDRYEIYDMRTDPDEMNNLLGNVVVRNEAGSVDQLVPIQADPELRKLFTDLQGRLFDLLEETGASREPDWERE